MSKEKSKIKKLKIPINKRSIETSCKYLRTEDSGAPTTELSKRNYTDLSDKSRLKKKQPVALKNTDYIKNLLIKDYSTKEKNRSKSKKKIINVNHNYNHNINININHKKKQAKTGKLAISDNRKREILGKREVKKEVKLNKQVLKKVLKQVKHTRLSSEIKEKKKSEHGSFSMISDESLFKKSKNRETSSKNRSRSFKISEGSDDSAVLSRKATRQ